MRILQKVASNSKKHIVIITSDQTLIPLAAAANIPVAKSLQSKPEIPEVPAIQVDDDGGDIIDGSSLADTKKLLLMALFIFSGFYITAKRANLLYVRNRVWQHRLLPPLE